MELVDAMEVPTPMGGCKARMRTLAKRALDEEGRGMELAARIACYYVEDALEGRLDNGLASNFQSGSRFKFACCRAQTHPLWHALVIAACCSHSLLAVLEPVPSASAGTCSAGRWWLRPLELLFLSVYVADIWMKVAYMGTATFLSLRGSKAWQTTYAALTVLLVLEALLVPSVRVMRPLRPIVLLLRSRAVRNFYLTVLRIFPSLLKVCMLLLFFILACALTMVRLLRGSETNHFSGTLPTFLKLGILLLTQDNYDTLLQDLLRCGNPMALVFFFAILVIGTLFLLQLVLGTVVDTYMVEAQKELRDRRVKQLRGFLRAFKALDLREEGRLRQPVFERFMRRLRPSDTDFERQLKFSLLSNRDGQMSGPLSGPLNAEHSLSGSPDCKQAPNRTVSLPESSQPFLFEATVDPIDFLHLITVLNHKFTEMRPGWDRRLGMEQPSWSSAAVCLLESRVYVVVQRTIMFLDLGVFLADAEALPIVGLVELNDLLQVFCVVDVLLRMMARGGANKFWLFSDWELRAYSICNVMFMAHIMLCRSVGWRPKSIAVLGAVRSLGVALSSRTLSHFSRAALTIAPAVMQMVAFVCIVHYSFTIIALDTMGSRVESFSTLPNAAETLTQMLVNVDTMSIVRDAVGKTHMSASLFFAAYYVLAVMVVLNLITALMIEFYRVSLAEAVERQGEKDSELTKRVQTVLKQMAVVASFSISRASRRTIAELRTSFLGGSNLEDEELLKHIQKETPVDLVALQRTKCAEAERRQALVAGAE